MNKRHNRGLMVSSAAGIAALLLLVFGSAFSPVMAVLAAGGDWPTYMNGIQHNGFTSDSTITVKNAAQAGIKWSKNPNGDIAYDSIFGQPVVSGGMIYSGSFDGNLYAYDTAGNVLWQQFLGRTVDYNECNPPEVGVADTATVTGGRVYVGGGDAAFYSLDAKTGAIIWRTALGTQPSYFLWSSPTYYKGSIYVGMASFGDCPLVRSFVAKLNANTGAIQGQFYTVPAGCIGAGVWSTPTIDSSTGIMYFETGNNDETVCPLAQTPLAFSMMAVDTATMTLVGHWQLPPSAQVPDSDWGATATLFSDNAGRQLVGAENKNGVFYAFNRANIDQGPVWQTRISVGGDCPQCGQAAISPAAFDGKWVYAGDGQTTIAGQACEGNVRALSPNDGSIKWETCLNGGTSTFPASVLGAVTVTPNLVIVGSGKSVVLIDKRNGTILNSVTYNGNASEPQPPYFWGSASVSNGVIYAGNMDGSLVAIGLP